MIHPSYQELIATINEGQDLDEAPVVSSRYSLVLATSKRARQIIGGAEPLVKVKKGMKPLSIAVEEMYKGEVTILPESEVEAEEETKYPSITSDGKIKDYKSVVTVDDTAYELYTYLDKTAIE